VQANTLNGVSAKVERLDTGKLQIVDCLSTEELAAHLVVGFSLLFEQHDFASGCGKTHGRHRTRQAAANYQMFR
jgi:hypothetical protein